MSVSCDSVFYDLATLRNLLREAKALGAQFRLSGHDVEIGGFNSLPGDLQIKLEHHRVSGLLWIYLGGEELDNPSLDLADELGIAVELVEIRADARRAIRTLIIDMRHQYTRDPVIGLDIETAPKPEYFHPVWSKLNKNGGLAAHQPSSDDKAGLSPHTATIASLQLYAGGTHCFVFRSAALRLVRDSHWLRRQRVIIHSAVFELKFLMHECRGDYPGRFECTAQAAGLLDGVGFGGENRALERVAKRRLRLDVDKGLQTSDWGAPRPSPGMLAYAACDSVVARRLWPGMYDELHRKQRWQAYKLQKMAAPAVADMENRGILLDHTRHACQIQGWSRTLAEGREHFTELAKRPPPDTDNEIRAWLNDTLTAGELSYWPRTEARQELSVSIDALKTIAYRDDVRAMIDIVNSKKLLSTFGTSLVDKICPVTNRLHPSFNLAATKAGRFSARYPNFQQFPSDKRAAGFRDAVVAAPGKVLIGADYSQIELRALGEVYQNRTIRQVYANPDPKQRDLHRQTAARISQIPIENVTDDMRARAKPINFGLTYGMRARGLVGYAYSAYGIVMTLREAEDYITAFFAAYYPLEEDLRENARLCRDRRGYIEIGCGRVVEAGWEKYGLSFQQCCNLPIQGVAADCMLRALTLVYDEFKACRIRGGLIATIHDEIIAEVTEDDAEFARDLLEACMLAAFHDTFPKASLYGVVEAKIGKTWGELK